MPGDTDLFIVYAAGFCTEWPLKKSDDQAVMIGDDPLTLTVKSLGKAQADPHPYGGRYPCGSLVYRGVWYYGTYCLAPDWNGEKIRANPPGTRYGLVLQKVRLLGDASR